MPGTIQLHNTLKSKKEAFQPKVAGQVNLYCCGPTVYDYAHIGNFRSFLMADLLTRVLKYAGYKVTKVQNITDVGHLTNDDLADADGDDKIAKKAKAEGKTAWDIAEYYTDAFIEDEKILRISPPDHRPRATDFIAEQIAMTKTLIEKGYAYQANGSVYFRTAKFPEYGTLSGNKLADLQAGARVEVNDEKEDPLDFALWKHADESHLMQWDFYTGQQSDPTFWTRVDELSSKNEKTEAVRKNFSESYQVIRRANPDATDEEVFEILRQGIGFPGWHIECSAMSQALLEHTDIHTGGEDNTFPHHECEIAQNQCSHGYEIPMWLHAKHLLVDGQKMSKSKGNFYTIRDLLAKGWKGEEIRYALLAAHYRTALNFTEDSLQQARSSIARIQEAHRVLVNSQWSIVNSSVGWIEAAREKFKASVCDDLNVSEALAVVFELISTGLKKRDENSLSADEAHAVVQFLEQDFNPIFDVLDLTEKSIPEAVTLLLQKRSEAREKKDFAKSDELRDQIKSLGWEVKDEAGGQSVSPL